MLMHVESSEKNEFQLRWKVLLNSHFEKVMDSYHRKNVANCFTKTFY